MVISYIYNTLSRSRNRYLPVVSMQAVTTHICFDMKASTVAASMLAASGSTKKMPILEDWVLKQWTSAHILKSLIQSLYAQIPNSPSIYSFVEILRKELHHLGNLSLRARQGGPMPAGEYDKAKRKVNEARKMTERSQCACYGHHVMCWA